MITALQRPFNSGKEYPTRPAADLKMEDHEIIARLYYLIGKLTDKQKKDLCKQFLNGSMTGFLLKAAIDMSSEQRFVFMKHLEEMQSKEEQLERRTNARKDCLINVNYKIQGRIFCSYILDISNSGAFIETSSKLSSGLKMLLNFSSPENRQPLGLIGEIVWSDSRGVGVKFLNLTAGQIQILQSFTEKTDEVVEIAS